MSKARKKDKTRVTKLPPRESPAREDAHGEHKSAWRSLRAWARAKRPVLGFVLLFGVFMGLFLAITFLPYVDKKLIPAYMRLNARASTVILNVFGEGASASGTSVSSGRFQVDIRHGCDAIAPTALFVAAVLAFPAPFRSKIPGAIIGMLVLALINLVRIVTLFYTGIFFPKAFEAMHVDVWQPVFILLALVFWVAWAWWATRGKVAQPDVSPETA